MRSTSWCVLSPTMERTCLNLFIRREWGHTKTSSTTSNGMNCKSCLFDFHLRYFLNFLKVLKSAVISLSSLCWHPPSLSKDYFPHRSSRAPAGVGTEPDFVRSTEPECQRLTRFQQTEESSRVSGQGLDALLWLQTVRRSEMFNEAPLH